MSSTFSSSEQPPVTVDDTTATMLQQQQQQHPRSSSLLWMLSSLSPPPEVVVRDHWYNHHINSHSCPSHPLVMVNGIPSLPPLQLLLLRPTSPQHLHPNPPMASILSILEEALKVCQSITEDGTDADPK
jgi:hypothetical protein